MAAAASPSSSLASSALVERGRLPPPAITLRMPCFSTLQEAQRTAAPNACGGTAVRIDGGCCTERAVGMGVIRCGGTDVLHYGINLVSRRNSLRRDPSFANGETDQVGRVVDVELLHQSPTMELGRFHADIQHFG